MGRLSSLRSAFLRSDGQFRAGWKVLLFMTVNWVMIGFAEVYAWQLGLLDSEVTWRWISGGLTLGLSWLFLAGEGRPLVSLGLRPGRRWGLEFLSGTLGGLLLMVIVALTVRALGGFHWEPSPNPLSALGYGAWIFLAVAFSEEISYRGYAFQRLAEGLGHWGALGLAGAFFAYGHWANPGMTGATRIWATLNIGLAGVLLGLCFLKTRSLALPMGLHLGWNWTQGSMLGFGVSGLRIESMMRPVFHGRPEWLTGGAFGLEASLPCAVFTTLAIFGLSRWDGEL
jgi:uncharacterized protein